MKREKLYYEKTINSIQTVFMYKDKDKEYSLKEKMLVKILLTLKEVEIKHCMDNGYKLFLYLKYIIYITQYILPISTSIFCF